MQLAILADTHIPGQADAIPEGFLEHIEHADHVIHCGDFGSIESYAALRELADRFTAVYGNADPLDIDLPAIASLTCEDVTLVASHGIVNPVERAIGSSEGVVFDRADWLDAIADTARLRAHTDETLVVGIGGHTHQVEDVRHAGVRVLNPGSATGVGPAEGRRTMMTAVARESDIEVNVHEA